MLRRDLPVIVPFLKSVSILLLYNCLYVYWKLLLHAHASRITLTSHVSHVSCRTLWQRLLVLFPTGRCTNGRVRGGRIKMYIDNVYATIDML